MDKERHTERDPFSRVYDARDDGFALGVADEDLHDEEDFGCLFPGRCCMPELHFVSECHTAGMAGEMYAHSALQESGEPAQAGVGPEERPPADAPLDDGIPF